MSVRRDPRPDRNDLVTWESAQRLPLVGPDGEVPSQVLVALETALRLPGSPEAIRAANYVRTFLTVTCDELADSRAQVLEDRAELDQLRAYKRATLTGQAERRAAVESAAQRLAAHGRSA